MGYFLERRDGDSIQIMHAGGKLRGSTRTRAKSARLPGSGPMEARLQPSLPGDTLFDMKTALRSLVIGLLAMGTLSAQEFVAPEVERREVVPAEPVRVRPTVEGIVKEIFTKRPWQLVNPMAPAEEGSGERMVSQDFGPGTPYHSTGLIVASIEF
jgi:hypothetical protein